MIISTMYARRLIADVYVVRSDYLRNNRQQVKDFVEVMMQANNDLQPLMKDLDNPRKMALLTASADIENLYYDAQFVDRSGNAAFLADDNYPHRLEVLNRNIQQAFNDIGLINSQTPIVAADWDYAGL